MGNFYNLITGGSGDSEQGQQQGGSGSGSPALPWWQQPVNDPPPPVNSIMPEGFDPETMYDPPEGWDPTGPYGMHGEALPKGAVQWTANGDPWYGTNNAFTEWWAKVKNGNAKTRTVLAEDSSLVARAKRLESKGEVKQSWSDLWDALMEQTAGVLTIGGEEGDEEKLRESQANSGEAAGKALMGTLSQISNRLQSTLNATKADKAAMSELQQLNSARLAQGKDALDDEETAEWLRAKAEEIGNQEKAKMSLSARASDFIVSGLGSLLNLGAEWTEKQLAKQQAREEIGDLSGLPDLIDDETYYDTKWPGKVEQYLAEERNNPILAENFSVAAKVVIQTAEALSPLNNVWNRIRFVAAPGSMKDKRAYVKDQAQAYRVLYSSFVEESIRAEYLTRLRDGEHPYLLQLELQRPGAEMIGQMIADPLNLLDIVGKAGGTAGKIKDFETYLLQYADEVADVGKVIDAGDDTVDMARFAEGTMDLMKRTGNMLDNMDPATNTGGKLRKWYNQKLLETGLFGWSVSGKRHHLQRVSRDMFRQIVRAAGDDPETVMRVVDNIVHLTSNDPLKVQTALANLGNGKVPMNLILSEGGARFANVIGAMVKNSEGVVDAQNFLERIQGFENGEDLLAWFSNKVDDISKAMFPTLEKQSEIAGKIAQKVELTERELMAGVDQLTLGEKVFLRAEKIKSSRIMTTINSFYANVYMGMSTGYALRNLMTNELHLFVDLGPIDYVKSLQWHMLEGGFDNYLQRLTKGAAGELATGGIGTAGEIGQKGVLGGDKLRMPGLTLGEWAEKWSSKRIYAREYQNVLNAQLPKIFDRHRRILKNAGVSDDQIRILERLIKDNYGDFDKAVDALKIEMNSGYVDLFAKGEWLPEEMMGHLDGLWLGDDVRRIIGESGDAPEVVQAKIRGLFNEVRKTAQKVTEEISYPPAGTGDNADDFMNGFNNLIADMDNIGHEGLKVAAHQAMMANKQSFDYWKEAVNMLLKLGDEYGVDVRSIIGNDELFDRIFYGTYFDDAYKIYGETITTPYNKIVDRVNMGTLSPQKAWDMIPELPGRAPDGLTAEGFGDLLWNTVFPVESRRFWKPHRDQFSVASSEIVYQILDNFKANGIEIDSAIETVVNRALRRTREAEAWDTGIIRDLDYLTNGIASGRIRMVTKAEDAFQTYNDIIRLGILNQVHKPGAPNNRLLNTINKYAGTNYKYLDVVPYDVAERALEARQLEKGNPFARLERVLVPEGAPPVQIEIPEPMAGVLDMAKQTPLDTPINEMDQRVRDMYKFWTDIFSGEADTFQKGGLIFDTKGPGTEVTGYSSTYMDWYRELGSPYYKGKRGIQAVQEALKAIARGDEGGMFGTPVIIERLKEQIYRRLDQTPEDYLDYIKGMIQAKGIEPNDIPDDWIYHLDAMGIDPRSTVMEDFFTDARRIPAPEGAQPASLARIYHEQMPQLDAIERQIMAGIKQNFGRTMRTSGDDSLDAALDAYKAAAGKDELAMRVVANEVATEKRNFALLNYQSTRNIDSLTGLVYPYQFWYGRTYPNWGRRIAQNPAVLAHYAKYKEAMAQIHANAPEWWQYNINLYELLGFGDKNNPMLFNLEALLNPLNGITGTDFEDPSKRINMWTTAIDNLNKPGPSIHPLINLTVAYALHLQGQQDAAARWAGRFIPFSNVTKAIGAVTGTDWLMTEWDPWVNLFSSGIDPYERRRVGREITDLWVNGDLTPEEAYDTAWMQDGEGWEMARKGAIHQRAWAVIGSFFGGVGVKQRNPSDMATDQMYDEIGRLMELRDLKTPEQFADEFNALAQKYPFMDMVLISTKAGDARDPAMAYHVINRIPPGQSSDYYEHVGLDRDLVDKFYDSKGDMTDWSRSDRDRFMAAIIDLNTLLSIPDGTTRMEWDQAKGQYRQLMTAMETQYGEKIQERIDTYYQLINAGEDERANEYLAMFPEVEEALEWKDGMIIQDQSGLLAAYYSGQRKISSYYMGLMYDEAKELFGEEIVDLQAQFFELERLSNDYLMEHPELVGYWDFRRDAKEQIANEAMNMFGPDILLIAEYYSGLYDDNERKAFRTAYPQLYQYWDFREVMYDSLDEQARQYFGTDIAAINDQYYSVVEDAQDAFKAEHPELERYWEFKDLNEEMINNKIIQAGLLLPEPKPAQIREDFDPSTAGVGAQNLAEFMQTDQDPLAEITLEEWQRLLNPGSMAAIAQMVQSGENIPSMYEKDIRYAAEDINEAYGDMGVNIDSDDVIQYIGMLIAQQTSQENAGLP